MHLTFELKTEAPKNFHPNYDDLLGHALGSIKPSVSSEKEKFPFNPYTKNWHLTIVFNDHKCIQGICHIPTKDNAEIVSPKTGAVNHIPLNFIISKRPAAGRTKPVVWHSPFINKMTQKNFNSIDTFFNDHYDYLIEETNKYKSQNR